MTSDPDFDGTLRGFLAFLARLEHAKIFYTLQNIRPEAVMVAVAVPGERWEIEFTESGELEIEVFRSEGPIHGAEKIEDLFARFTD